MAQWTKQNYLVIRNSASNTRERLPLINDRYDNEANNDL